MQPRPWISHPQGVTIRYCEGLPIGRLVGVVLPAAAGQSPSPVIDLGGAERFTADRDGRLYLRVNDFWSELADNAGGYRVEVRRP
jgi:hypothetical protein